MAIIGIFKRIQGISTGGNVECDMSFINPESLQLPPDDLDNFQLERDGAAPVSVWRID